MANPPALPHLDDGLDRSEGGVGEFFELAGHFVEGDAVGDPEVGVDFPFADESDDFVEIFRHRIARGEQGEFASMEDWGVGECEIGSGNPHIDDAAGEGGVFEAGGHRLRTAGGIDDHVRKFATGDGIQFRKVGAIRLEGYRMLDAEMLFAELKAAGNHVHHDGFHIHQFEKLQTGKPDGTRADDEHAFTRLGIPTLHGMIADCQGLHQSELIIR